MENTVARGARLSSIDCLRGIIMVIMALDHVRDFFHDAATRFDLLDLDLSNPALFFTRFVTHYCAPAFAFLAGCGAGLSLNSGRRTGRDLRAYLATRGAWLIFLDATLVTLLWTFSIHPTPVFGTPAWSVLGVLWAIGFSMMMLALVCALPRAAIAAIGLAIVAGHNLFDAVTPAQFGALAPLWTALHAGGPVNMGVTTVLVFYPVLPWIGIVFLGFGASRVFAWPPLVRQRALLALGGLCLVLFVLIRGLNVYGDTTPWQLRDHGLGTFYSFLNVQKYPPSLAYALVTLGPALILLALLEYARGAFVAVMAAIGRVPLFYYLLHLMLIHLVAMLVDWGQGSALAKASEAFWLRKPGDGPAFSLGETYAVWIAIVLALAPACLWYDSVKRRSRSALLSYL